MRVLVGGIRHEVNSFVPGTTGLDVFERYGVHEGQQIIDEAASSMAGAVKAASERGLELVPTLSAAGHAGGPVVDDAYEHLAHRFLAMIERERDSIDGIYLQMHGAMATTRRDDPEGELFEQIRGIVGADLPIATSLDLHCHFTDRMAANVNVAVGFRTCPHTDTFETGERAMHLLADLLDGRRGPRAHTVHRKIGLMTSSEAHDTTFGPLTSLQARARELEEQPGVLAISIFATQPWMDVPNVGWSAVVSTDGDPTTGQDIADRLAQELWDARETYHVVKTRLDEAIAAAHRVANNQPGSGPVVVADGADSPSAGAAGDSTALLAHIVATGDDVQALMLVTDAQAVATAMDAGVGATVEMNLGGHITTDFFSPLAVTATVAALHTPQPGEPAELGRAAVLTILNTTVIATEHKADGRKLDSYRRFGVEPTDYQLVQAKSAGGYRAEFEPIASEVYDLDTTGPCDSDLPRLPFERITRPLWPFDPELDQPWH
ncbi:MAG: M81 family metallopeptidase [Nitriliruptoraceae bacterium]